MENQSIIRENEQNEASLNDGRILKSVIALEGSSFQSRWRLTDMPSGLVQVLKGLGQSKFG
jgi:hypothetical protein